MKAEDRDKENQGERVSDEFGPIDLTNVESDKVPHFAQAKPVSKERIQKFKDAMNKAYWSGKNNETSPELDKLIKAALKEIGMQQRQVKQISKGRIEEFKLVSEEKIQIILDKGDYVQHRDGTTAQAIVELQQRQVPDKRDCPICGSDDMFSFQQTHYKCRSCDYRFTK